MEKKTKNATGASPMPAGNRKPGRPLFDEEDSKSDSNSKRDVTGQTDTNLKHMKQRLAEVPKKSAGSEHDKKAFEKGRKSK